MFCSPRPERNSQRKKNRSSGPKTTAKEFKKSNNALFERNSQLIEDQIRNRAKLAWKASTDEKGIRCCNPRRQTTHLLWSSLSFWTYQSVVYLRTFPILEENNGSVDSFSHKNLLSKILFYKGRSSFNERGCYRLYLRRKCQRRDFHIIGVQTFGWEFLHFT
ncbi:hypothetical protein CEXT_292881 [Caerostris extrusa]|uniref:Uncharacterized protein n=1 Tax=Caerostris extrusa TaxID=172846 RepID=A0AAV4P8X2_CAEEX|nr:hypothetical protein CEXT_292881 [Caerostris extrusa]